jgi:hypothetical protein
MVSSIEYKSATSKDSLMEKTYDGCGKKDRCIFVVLPDNPVVGNWGILMGKRPKNDGRFRLLAIVDTLKSLNHVESHLTTC